VPVASVSRKISELEEHLKTGILIRSSRRMILTDAGRSYVEACKRSLKNILKRPSARRRANTASPRENLTVTVLVFAAHGRPEKPEDLRDHDCINFDNLASPEAWRFVNTKGDFLVPVRSRLTVNTAEGAIDAAVAGRGVLRMMS
jgi:DNA-binding transcriptional LysR family regulator